MLFAGDNRTSIVLQLLVCKSQVFSFSNEIQDKKCNYKKCSLQTVKRILKVKIKKHAVISAEFCLASQFTSTFPWTQSYLGYECVHVIKCMTSNSCKKGWQGGKCQILDDVKL